MTKSELIDREIILTKVEASDRMKVYAVAQKKQEYYLKWYLPIPPVFCGLMAVMVYLDILPPSTWDAPSLLALGIAFTIFMYIAIKNVGALWRPPTQEEMDEYGDRII